MPWRLDRIIRSDRRIFARSSLTLLGRGISKFAVVLFLILAARLLTKDEFGLYSYVLVLAYTFGILTDPQVSIIAGREVAAGHHSVAVAYRATFPIVLVTATIGAVALLAFGLVDSGPGTTFSLLFIAGTFLILNRLYALALDMLRALGRFGTEAAIEVIGTVLLVAGASAVAATGLGVTAVLAVFAVHSLIATLTCRVVLREDLGSPANLPSDYRQHLLRSGVKLAASAAATAVATRGPMIVLGSTASAASVAIYSASIRFGDASYLLALTAGQALLPSIAALLGEDAPRAARVVRRAVGITFVLGVILAAIVAPFSTEIARLLFGDTYSSSGPLISVIVAGAPFMGMFWISWFALCAYGAERDLVRLALVCAFASLLAALLVIPDAGASGAVWVYVGALAALGLSAYVSFEHRARAVEANS